MLKRKIHKAITIITACLLMCNSLVAFAETEESVAKIGSPSGILQTKDGQILVTDISNKVVWDYKKQEIVAGFSGVKDIYGEPFGGYSDNDALTSTFEQPWAIAPFLDGYAITDSENNVIRYFSDNKVRTIAGNIDGKAGNKDGQGIKASFNHPTGIVSDGNGNLYVSDTGNGTIRKIMPNGQVSTYVDKGEFLEPTGLAYENGILYVADTGNHRICKVEKGKVVTVAGKNPLIFDGDDYPTGDYIDGLATQAGFNNPEGLAVENGVIYVSDTGNSAIRKIQNGQVSTLLKSSNESMLYPISPRGIAVVSDKLYVADYFAGIVFNISCEKEVWYKPAIDFIKNNDLLSGIPNESFEPNSLTNRGLFVTIMYNFEQFANTNADMTGQHSFEDVSQMEYYNNAVAWANTNKIVQGYENKFYPQDEITREEIVTILYGYSTDKTYDITKELTGFSDANLVSEYAKIPMKWAVDKGIIKGSNGEIMPQATATKAQISQMFLNYYQSIN